MMDDNNIYYSSQLNWRFCARGFHKLVLVLVTKSFKLNSLESIKLNFSSVSLVLSRSLRWYAQCYNNGCIVGREIVVFIYWFSFEYSNCWQRLWFASLFILRFVIDERAHTINKKNWATFRMKALESSELRRNDTKKRG